MTAIRNHYSKVLSLAIGIALALAPAFAAQKPPRTDAPAAPLPAQILSGRKVFISYAGGENLETPLVLVFSGRADRVYNQFYAAMKDWGHYELVSAPADADMVFQIGFSFADNGIKAPEMGRLRLDIRDPRSNVLLWSLSQFVQVAILKGNRDKNLDLAMGVIVDGVKDLVTQPAPAQPPNHP
jgi:hypothetical protein